MEKMKHMSNSLCQLPSQSAWVDLKAFDPSDILIFKVEGTFLSPSNGGLVRDIDVAYMSCPLCNHVFQIVPCVWSSVRFKPHFYIQTF